MKPKTSRSRVATTASASPSMVRRSAGDGPTHTGTLARSKCTRSDNWRCVSPGPRMQVAVHSQKKVHPPDSLFCCRLCANCSPLLLHAHCTAGGYNCSCSFMA